MKVLAIETSSAHGSVAICDDGHVLIERSWHRTQNRGEFLMPAVSEMLTHPNELKSLEAIAVTRGPGSFTGIRASINAAKALSYVLKIPIYGFSSLDVLAAQVPVDLHSRLVVMINAFGQSIYVAEYQKKDSSWSRQQDIQVVSLQRATVFLSSPALCLGDAFSYYEKALSSENSKNIIRQNDLSDIPSVTGIAKLLRQSSASTQTFDWNQLEPLYLRASGAEEKLKGQS